MFNIIITQLEHNSGYLLICISVFTCGHTGAFGGGMRNAFGMIAMVQAQSWATAFGLRGQSK